MDLMEIGWISSGFLEGVIKDAPMILGAILIVVVGYLIALGVKKGLKRVFKRVKFDESCKKVNIQQILEKLGIESPSSLLSNLAFGAALIISIYFALDRITIERIQPALNAISSVLIGLMVAISIMVVGIFIMEILITILKRIFRSWKIEKVLAPVDRAMEKTGLKTLDILYIAIRIFIILLFLELALRLFRVDFLIPYVNPILIFIPRVIVAIFVIFVGIAITEFVIKIIFGVMDAIDIRRIIEPLETTMRSRGIIMRVLRWILRIYLLLLFFRFSFSIVNISTWAIDSILAYLPRILRAVIIVIVSWWFSFWLGNRFEKFGVERDLPFLDFLTFMMKFVIIFIGTIVALNKIDMPTTGLYFLLAFILGAFAVSIAIVFGYGFKDVGSNLASSLQLKRTAEIGDTAILGEYSGKIVEITNLSTTIETGEGKMVVPNSRFKDAIIIKKVKDE